MLFRPPQVGRPFDCEWAADCTPEIEQIFPFAVTDDVLANDLMGVAAAAKADPFITPLRISFRLEARSTGFLNDDAFN